MVYTNKTKSYWVYILCSKKEGVLYVGVTNDLIRRIYQHKSKQIKGFTYKYNVDKLVYASEGHDIKSAIAFEKRIKHWRREWKVALIEKHNPEWKDLFANMTC
jgi:putative endonuclease